MFYTFDLFCRESSLALSTTPGLWTCVEDLSTLKNLSLTSTESYKTEPRNKFNTIHINPIRSVQSDTMSVIPSYVPNVPKCNFHSEIYLSNICLIGKGTLTSIFYRLIACRWYLNMPKKWFEQLTFVLKVSPASGSKSEGMRLRFGGWTSSENKQKFVQ